MCSIAFSPLVQAHLSRFIRLVWRIIIIIMNSTPTEVHVSDYISE